MTDHYRTTALLGGVVTGLFTLFQYGLLARQAPQRLATGALTLDRDGQWLRGWIGPSLTIPAVTLVIGLVAGWLATGPAARPTWAGARAGAAAGFGALLAVTLVFTALLAWLGTDAAVQTFVRMSELHPEARLAPDVIP